MWLNYQFIKFCFNGFFIFNTLFIFIGSYSTVLRELVAEFTLTDNVANVTTSLLKSLSCSEDSITLGSCLQDTDQRLLEEQVSQSV